MRVMVAYKKGEDIRYIGHLDLMRSMQRALRRSGLPISYSNGFNPHIRLSFAAPLSVGVVGLHELMEVPLQAGVSDAEFMRAMNAVLPHCMRIMACREISDAFPTLMSLVAGSRYTIRLERSNAAERVVQKVDAFMALASYTALRKTKSGENDCDIRPFVRSAACSEDDNGYVIQIETLCTSAGALKPSLWFNCLCEFAGEEPLECVIYRDAILAKNARGALIPMEELPNV
ncbi:MAG: TIGR03936 family radical SAM-associated protein [Clostridia bacterium]